MKNVSTFSDFINESESTPLEQYTTLLKKHDWYYQMSDDDRVYQSGLKEKNAIKAAFLALPTDAKKAAYDAWCEQYKKHYPESKHECEFEKFTGF
jgi:hypothetical protein